VQPALDRPRFRNDLVAQPLEDEGVRYVDVTDPNSGNTFRFYDVEYSIACAMDGQRSIDALAEWTFAELGIETSPDELQNVVSTLADLGYLEAGRAAAEVVHEDVAAAYDQAMELGPPGRSPLEEPAPPAAPVEPVELGPAGNPLGAAAEPPRVEPAQAAHELEELDLEEMAEPEERMGTAPPPLPADIVVRARTPEEEASFAGLLEEEEAAAAAAAAAAEAGAAPRVISLEAEEPPHPLDDEDPTMLPRPMMAPPDEEPDDMDTDMRVDLSAHLTVGKQEVADAVRSSRVYAVPEVPRGLHIADDAETMHPLLPEDRAASVASLAPSATTPIPDRLPERATALPERPPTARPSRPLAPIEPSRVPPAIRAPERRGSSLAFWLIVLAVVAIGAGVIFFFKDAIFGLDGPVHQPTAPPKTAPVVNPPATEPKVEPKTEPKVEPAVEPKTEPKTEPKAELAPLAATIREEAGGGGEVKAPAEGQIVWVAEEGATVEAGGVVAKYLGAKKEEAKLLEGQQRGEYYAKVLAEAEKFNDEDKIGLAKGKVEEKKRMVDEATTALEKLVVKAPAAGKVTKASRPRAVKAGDVVVETSGEAAKTLRATFDAGASAAKFSAGQEVSLSSKEKAISAVVEGVADGKVTVRVPSGAAAGDEVKLALPK
jgi:hypothetical protein